MANQTKELNKYAYSNLDEVEYSQSGYYDRNGVLVDSESWINTGLVALGECLAIKAKSHAWETPNIIFFNDSNVFMGLLQYSENTTELAAIPSGATQFIAIRNFNDDYSSVYTGNIKYVVESMIELYESQNAIALNSKNIPAVELEFSQSGYYTIAGVLNASTSFHSTPVTAVSNNLILIKGVEIGDYNYTNIVFFNSSMEFINDEKFTEDTFKYIKVPSTVAYFAVSKRINDSDSFVKTGSPEYILNTYNDVLNSLKGKPTYNYFPNTLLMSDIRAGSSSESVIGLGANFEIEHGDKFKSFGVQSYLHLNMAAYGNNPVFTFGQKHFRQHLYDTKKINIRMLLMATANRTVPIKLYRRLISNSNFSSIYSQNFSLVANEIKEVVLEIDLSAYDLTDFEFMQFYFEGISSGDYYLASPHIWDGDVSFRLIKPQLGSRDIKDIAFGVNYVDGYWMFIGDSITFQNDRYWKGFLKESFGISYLSEYDYNYKCAQGGKALFPPVSEDTSNYSIWYLCGNQRLTDYPCKYINLSGGTNDLGTGDDVIDLGTAADTPYLDTDAERPAGLTWASAFKGCIEMLQRDFPNIEIIICTVLDYKGGVAKDAYGATGFSRAEYMARLQMEIANDYGLTCVPWFWCTGIQTDADGVTDTYDLFTSDGIHPNKPGARRMAKIWADTLFLK